MRRVVSSLNVALLFLSLFAFVFAVQLTKAQLGVGKIYINADGSISPSTAPITTADNITYTLTGNVINDSIYVERNGIVVDGTGYAVQGPGYNWEGPGPPPTFEGIDLYNVSSVAIKNMKINAFYYGVYIGSSSNVTVSGNNITNSYGGVLVYESANCTVSTNYVAANNQFGIAIVYSSDNAVSENEITTTSLYGVWVESLANYNSSYNSICGNDIVGNDYGVWAFSYLTAWQNGNSISRNNIANNNYGVELDTSVGFSLTANNITNNGYGIFFDSSYGNEIYHNNFNNNTQQVNAAQNVWDNGYPSGGNYWSDYLARYPNATEIDDSGIWNTPYVIDGGGAGSDRYPLMKPYNPEHDTTVKVTPSKTIIGEGYSLKIKITVANPGDFIETFNVTVYANTTRIKTQTLMLTTSRTSTSTTFTWNTTGFAYGNYTISANVTLAPGETNSGTASFIYGTVKVTIPGDINGDGIVNILDFGLIAVYWGQTVPPAPANADILNTGIINILDIGIIAANWGQSIP